MRQTQKSEQTDDPSVKRRADPIVGCVLRRPQALDGTWDDYRNETRNRGARRNNFDDATDFMGWYMNKTRDKLGIPLSDAMNQYLAYHDGHSGYARGTWKSKAWLVDVSQRVAARAQLYQGQLARCRYR